MIKHIVFDFYGVLLNLNTNRINNSLISLVDNLSKEYQLNIFSNSSIQKMRRYDAKQPFLKYFKEILTPDIPNFRKPEEESFKILLTCLQCVPSEILLVDDSFENINIANQKGIKTLLYEENIEFELQIKKLL